MIRLTYIQCYAQLICGVGPSYLFVCFVYVCVFSHEAAHAHAYSTVQISDQEPEMAVACHEGFLFHQPILSAGGVCRVHQRHYAKVCVCVCVRV